MTSLVGEFHHKLDAKGRVSLPSGFRRTLSENLKVTLSPEKECLYVFEPEAFSEWVNLFFKEDGGYNPRSRRHVNTRRLLNSRARDIEVDAAGRINISADLRSEAGLEKEVVINGDTDHLEIWDAKRWSEFVEGCDLLDLMED